MVVAAVLASYGHGKYWMLVPRTASASRCLQPNVQAEMACHCWGLSARRRIARERRRHDGAMAELNRSGRRKSHS